MFDHSLLRRGIMQRGLRWPFVGVFTEGEWSAGTVGHIKDFDGNISIDSFSDNPIPCIPLLRSQSRRGLEYRQM